MLGRLESSRPEMGVGRGERGEMMCFVGKFVIPPQFSPSCVFFSSLFTFTSYDSW